MTQNAEVLFNAPQNQDVVEQHNISYAVEALQASKRLIGRAALALVLAAGAGAAAGAGEAMLEPHPREAGAVTEFANDYPNLDAAEYNLAAYEWWVDENGNGVPNVNPGANDELMSSRGFDYLNCTDGAAYWAKKYTGVTIPGSWGNAKNWDDAASAYTVKGGEANSIEPGDIAQSDDGSYGHVGFVTNVTKNANGVVTSIQTAELNAAGTGKYTPPTYTTKNASGKFVRPGSGRDWDHFIDVNGAGKGLGNENWPSSGGGGGGGLPGGSETIGVYNPIAAVFHERNSNTPGPADLPVPYGNSNWIPLAGDWNNDKVFTPGAYDPAAGIFYLSNSNVPGGPADVPAFMYGNIGWIPIAGDWNGNGYWSIGMYDPATATFYLRDSNSAGGADYTFQFGNGGWKPITGDWDGHDDGNAATTVGVYDPNTAKYYLNNENDSSAAESTIQYGNLGWTPIAGDWDGNGFSSIGAYDPNTATFYLRNMNSSGPADITVQYGIPGWKPVIGDWDGV